MGPRYITTLSKIQIFGFRIDGISEQLNVVIDESETIGKDGTIPHGLNSVLSMIDWTMQTYGVCELICAIHVDNCPGSIYFYKKSHKFMETEWSSGPRTALKYVNTFT